MAKVARRRQKLSSPKANRPELIARNLYKIIARSSGIRENFEKHMTFSKNCTAQKYSLWQYSACSKSTLRSSMRT